jgi:hypothetical protein
LVHGEAAGAGSGVELRLFPNYRFVSLDLPTEAEQAEKEPQSFLSRHPSPTIIDEVQYAPRLFRQLKVAIDASRARNGQFLLTGSQKFDLMTSVSESLAGRADILELETLSWAEIRAALPRTGLETAIVRGGFPELHANPDIDHVAFYNSYLATYLERDVRSLAKVGNLRDFERFLRACALRSANLLTRLIWRVMSASLLPQLTFGCPRWRLPGRSCCLSHGSPTVPSPSSKARNCIGRIPDSFALY